MRPNTASIAEMVSAAVFPVSRAASVTRDLRSCKTSTGRVHLQMMRSPSQVTGTTAFVAPCQITPQGLCLLSGSIDEGVDCLAADGPQPRFIARFQPTGDLFGRPSLGEPITHEQT